MNENGEVAPFSVPVNVRRLPRKGVSQAYSATDEVALALARRFELIEVARFECEAIVTPWKKDGIKIVGSVKAAVVQPCAVSADPLEATVWEEIDAIYVPEGSRLARPKMNEEGEIVLDPEGDDLPETFAGDVLDLADVWLEFFALGLDPFARLEGASLAGSDADAGDPEDAGNSPFAALAQLKKH